MDGIAQDANLAVTDVVHIEGVVASAVGQCKVACRQPVGQLQVELECTVGHLVVECNAHRAGITRLECEGFTTHAVAIVHESRRMSGCIHIGIEDDVGNHHDVRHGYITIAIHVGGLKDERTGIPVEHVLGCGDDVGYRDGSAIVGITRQEGLHLDGGSHIRNAQFLEQVCRQ